MVKAKMLVMLQLAFGQINASLKLKRCSLMINHQLKLQQERIQNSVSSMIHQHGRLILMPRISTTVKMKQYMDSNLEIPMITPFLTKLSKE